jgi:CheY-like chemotaxis protein
MKKLGLTYTIVENGLDAINQLKSEDYTILLMDLEMPVLNGEDAMKKIRAGEAGEKYSHMPVYAMSAYSINEIKEKCLREGFTGYITKPVDLKMLKQILTSEIKK